MRLDSGAGGWLEKHPEGPALGQTPESRGDFQDWTRTFGTEKQILEVSNSLSKPETFLRSEETCGILSHLANLCIQQGILTSGAVSHEIKTKAFF